MKLGLNKKHLNAAELQEFLDEKKILPADPMTPYIVKAELDVDSDGRMTYNILMTSRHLIEEHLSPGSSDLLGIDHTYSLNCEGCPIMVCGNITQSGVFCPLFFVIGNREDAANTSFALDWIKSTADVLPQALMADGSPTFSKALRTSWPDEDVSRLMCK